jgi:hypothetical protein
MSFISAIRGLFARKPGTAIVPFPVDEEPSSFADDATIIDAEFEEIAVTGDERIVDVSGSALLGDETAPMLALPPPELPEAPPVLPETFRRDLLATINIIVGEGKPITAAEVDRLAASEGLALLAKEAPLPTVKDRRREVVIQARIRKTDGDASPAEVARRAAYTENAMVAIGRELAEQRMARGRTGTKTARRADIADMWAKSDATWLWAALLLLEGRVDTVDLSNAHIKLPFPDIKVEEALLRNLLIDAAVDAGAAEDVSDKAAAIAAALNDAGVDKVKVNKPSPLSVRARLSMWGGRYGKETRLQAHALLWQRLENHAVQALSLVLLVKDAA